MPLREDRRLIVKVWAQPGAVLRLHGTDAIVLLEAMLPITPNGKVDGKRLPQMPFLRHTTWRGTTRASQTR